MDRGFKGFLSIITLLSFRLFFIYLFILVSALLPHGWGFGDKLIAALKYLFRDRLHVLPEFLVRY